MKQLCGTPLICNPRPPTRTAPGQPTARPSETLTLTPRPTLEPTQLPPTPTPPPVVEQTVITYKYDKLYRLTEANYSDGRYFHYTYDAVGNRLTQQVCVSAGNCVTTNYTYDNANRLATAGGVAQTWDNNGNLLGDGASTYTYDAANRLKTVTQGANSYSYVYNGTGDRLQQTVNGATTTYTLDLTAGLTQVLGDGTNTYLYGYERIAQNSTAAGKQYFLNDALGSVRRLTNAGGAPTLTRGYEPYGKVSSSSGAGSTAYGFAGEWTDNTGLIHLRARYYASGVGRFVSKDPWRGDAGRPMSYNGWLYVYANPTNLTDPSGWCGGENETPCPPTTPTATATPRPPIVMRTPTAIVYSPCLDRPCPRPATKLKGDCWATDTTRTGQWYEPDTFEGWRVLRFKKTKRSFLFEMTDEVNRHGIGIPEIGAPLQPDWRFSENYIVSEGIDDPMLALGILTMGTGRFPLSPSSHAACELTVSTGVSGGA